MTPDSALIACRFLRAASLMMLWGGSAYVAWLVPTGLAASVSRRLGKAVTATVLLAILATLAALPIETADIGEGWSDVLQADAVGAFLFDTTTGRAWQIQAMVSMSMLAPFLFGWRARPSLLAVASGFSLASVALAGHAVMQDGFVGAAHRINDALHVLCGGAWLGALIPLLPILHLLRKDETRAEARIALMRFSTAGHVAVCLVILTGIANTLLILHRLPIDPSSPYQVLLLVKVALVSVMTALAVINRYVLVPLARRESWPIDAIAAGSLAEIALGIAAIACVAVFGTWEP